MIGHLPYFVAFWIFCVALYAIATSRNLIHAALCLALMQSATYLVILAAGFRTAAGAPVFSDVPPTTPAVDPVVHALVLTDVVVSTTMSSLLLALGIQLFKDRGTLDPREMRPFRQRK